MRPDEGAYWNGDPYVGVLPEILRRIHRAARGEPVEELGNVTQDELRRLGGADAVLVADARRQEQASPNVVTLSWLPKSHNFFS